MKNETKNLLAAGAVMAGAALAAKRTRGTSGIGGGKSTQELEDAIQSILFSGYGHYKVKFLYRGKEYSFTTTDTLAIDRINDHKGGADDREVIGWYTYRQALAALYEEGKRANGLG